MNFFTILGAKVLIKIIKTYKQEEGKTTWEILESESGVDFENFRVGVGNRF